MIITTTALAASDWASDGTFGAGMIATGVATIATMVNYHLFRTQVDPHVIIYAAADDKRPSVILLVIENVGRGLAKQVSFKCSSPLPEHAYGFEDAPLAKPMTSGPILNGIPALGPGAKRVFTWGQYGGIHKFIGSKVIDVTIRFKGDRIGMFDATEHEVVCPIEIKSFEGTDASDKNYDKEAAKQLKRIADVVEASFRGS